MKRPGTRNHNVKSARQCSGAVKLQNVDPRSKQQFNTIEHWWADFTLWRVAAVRATHTLRQLGFLFGCSTCKSCYNLFHGFVDRQRVTVWSSGCALEYFPCILHSTGVAVWVRICFGFSLFWFAWDWAWFGLDLLWSGLGLIGRVLGGTWFCASSLVINLFHGHGRNHQFCETLSKLWSSEIRQLCTGIIWRHSLTRYLAGLVCSQTYTWDRLLCPLRLRSNQKKLAKWLRDLLCKPEYWTVVTNFIVLVSPCQFGSRPPAPPHATPSLHLDLPRPRPTHSRAEEPSHTRENLCGDRLQLRIWRGRTSRDTTEFGATSTLC